MEYTQNEKILQVTEKTLIIWIDIAKEKHYQEHLILEGVEYGRHMEFKKERKGIENFLKWTIDLMKTNGKGQLMVGMEPICQYWLCFADVAIRHF